MLVLKRKVGATIIIETPAGERIEVVVTETERGAARLGITAPAAVRIWRSELGHTFNRPANCKLRKGTAS